MSSMREPFWTRSKPKRESKLYTTLRPWAERVKIVLQFLIGIGLVLLLLVKLIPWLCTLIPWDIVAHRIQHLITLSPLDLVATALAYSAGFELAYTLFTPGPDEAVEPVIMGLAAAMLLEFSKVDRIDVVAGCGAVVFVIA
jgi:hypothetical protein